MAVFATIESKGVSCTIEENWTEEKDGSITAPIMIFGQRVVCHIKTKLTDEELNTAAWKCAKQFFVFAGSQTVFDPNRYEYWKSKHIGECDIDHILAYSDFYENLTDARKKVNNFTGMANVKEWLMFAYLLHGMFKSALRDEAERFTNAVIKIVEEARSDFKTNGRYAQLFLLDMAIRGGQKFKTRNVDDELFINQPESIAVESHAEEICFLRTGWKTEEDGALIVPIVLCGEPEMLRITRYTERKAWHRAVESICSLYFFEHQTNGKYKVDENYFYACSQASYEHCEMLAGGGFTNKFELINRLIDKYGGNNMHNIADQWFLSSNQIRELIDRFVGDSVVEEFGNEIIGTYYFAYNNIEEKGLIDDGIG